ncbi:DsbC family protein [Erythrobacter litoralis]|uniref:DsbC family protein n=1 Tax=Erythrobacter litoralis TaxID=39960 RepID=UPI002434DEC5|nr:DsbC family protein [Erythrobacter litoralis]MDG6079898.1 DsbC family protein [Erythrobacter litoralis]
MNYANQRPGLKARVAHVSLALASAAAVLTAGVSVVTAMPAQAAIARDVVVALKLRLPKTPIDALDCTTFAPWCEVVSGDTLFYIDEAARYLFVGRLYDMQERRDVTATRLLELNPDLLAAGAARAAGHGEAAEQPMGGSKPAPAKVDLSALPAEGAIRWGNPKGPRLVVFSDFQCGYCKRLTGELIKAGVEVEERPISIFGAASRRLSESVICAKDPVAALHAAYEGKPVSPPKSCTRATALDANEAFARDNGFAGTPVIVRASDGAVLHGYRDAATLRAFAAKAGGVR